MLVMACHEGCNTTVTLLRAMNTRCTPYRKADRLNSGEQQCMVQSQEWQCCSSTDKTLGSIARALNPIHQTMTACLPPAVQGASLHAAGRADRHTQHSTAQHSTAPAYHSTAQHRPITAQHSTMHTIVMNTIVMMMMMMHQCRKPMPI